MIVDSESYGNDRGYRIAYTILSAVSLEFKATSQVNSDADEGLDVGELKKVTKLSLSERE